MPQYEATTDLRIPGQTSEAEPFVKAGDVVEVDRDMMKISDVRLWIITGALVPFPSEPARAKPVEPADRPEPPAAKHAEGVESGEVVRALAKHPELMVEVYQALGAKIRLMMPKRQSWRRDVHRNIVEWSLVNILGHRVVGVKPRPGNTWEVHWLVPMSGKWAIHNKRSPTLTEAQKRAARLLKDEGYYLVDLDKP